MEETIERLKKEKNESLKQWFQIGKDKGQVWAKEAHYDELQMVVNAKHQRVPMKKLIEFESGNEDWFKDEIYDQYPVIKGTEPDATLQAGFMEGVREFWNEIQGKIQRSTSRARQHPTMLLPPSCDEERIPTACPEVTLGRKKGSRIKVRVPWCNSEEDFVTMISEGDWVVTADDELISLGFDAESPDHVKERFYIYDSGNRTTYWLRLFCEEHHPEVDFDEEFLTDRPGVFGRYQEKFGHDYEEWVGEQIYQRLKGELAKKGYEISW